MSQPDAIEIQHCDEATHLTFTRQIDYMLIDRAKRICNSTANMAFQKSIILDFAAIDSVSSMVLGGLVDFCRNCKDAGRRLFLVGLTPNVMSAFRSTGLDRFFEIGETADVVVETLARPGR